VQREGEEQDEEAADGARARNIARVLPVNSWTT
jgi:hypothetical protein